MVERAWASVPGRVIKFRRLFLKVWNLLARLTDRRTFKDILRCQKEMKCDDIHE